ncbi:hypothetical protein ACFL1P_01275 [Patescibacteria group bacterium]
MKRKWRTLLNKRFTALKKYTNQSSVLQIGLLAFFLVSTILLVYAANTQVFDYRSRAFGGFASPYPLKGRTIVNMERGKTSSTYVPSSNQRSSYSTQSGQRYELTVPFDSCPCGEIFGTKILCGEVHDNTDVQYYDQNNPAGGAYCKKFACMSSGWQEIGYATHPACSTFRETHADIVDIPPNIHMQDTSICGDDVCSGGESLHSCEEDCGDLIESALSQDVIEDMYEQSDSTSRDSTYSYGQHRYSSEDSELANNDTVTFTDEAPNWWLHKLQAFFTGVWEKVLNAPKHPDGDLCGSIAVCNFLCENGSGYRNDQNVWVCGPEPETVLEEFLDTIERDEPVLEIEDVGNKFEPQTESELDHEEEDSEEQETKYVPKDGECVPVAEGEVGSTLELCESLLNFEMP